MFAVAPTLWIGESAPSDTTVQTVSPGVTAVPLPPPVLLPEGYSPGAVTAGTQPTRLPLPDLSPSRPIGVVNPPTTTTQTPAGTVISPVVPRALPPSGSGSLPTSGEPKPAANGSIDPVTVGLILLVAFVAWRMLR